MKYNWIGIDYGSKMAGTTVISWFNHDSGLIEFVQSVKKQDADKLILKIVTEINPKKIFIDAPLSLPKAFFGDGDDFFYRKSDRELGAMSPMFLGGLTARAIKLKTILTDSGIKCFEAYPAALAEVLKLKEVDYKKGTVPGKIFIEKLSQEINLDVSEKIFSNWHRVDSLLAWKIGYRHSIENHHSYGDENEGQIIV